jgi:hypothetical protein
MFESGIGPGVRSNRLGTWSLITLALAAFLPWFDHGRFMWLPLWACAGTTLAAIGFGLSGLVHREQRRPALWGLLKAAVPVALFGLFLLALSSMNFD